MTTGLVWALGLMSGTSTDGIDAALIRTDGEDIAAFGPTLFRPWPDADRAVLRRAMVEAAGIADRAARPGVVAEAEAIVTAAHIAAVGDLLAEAASEGIRPEVIGFHGQTVFHAPERGLTMQIGDAEALARASGLPVVHDFRAADVAAGGQGAPLVPVYHRALAKMAGLEPPVAFLNIGGVANLTLIGADERLLAFDTGPGNAIMDDIVLAETGERFDRDGAIAARGTVDAAVVAEVTGQSAYLKRPPPKSLDRGDFPSALVDRPHLRLEDRLATAAEVIALTVKLGLDHLQDRPRRLVVCGGGARNGFLLGRIGALTGVPVATAGDLGLDTDFIEAQAFAYLAVRRLNGLPATWPGTTGVPGATVGGEVALPG